MSEQSTWTTAQTAAEHHGRPTLMFQGWDEFEVRTVRDSRRLPQQTEKKHYGLYVMLKQEGET